MKIAVIGYGYWGPKLSRNIVEFEHTELSMVIDTDPDRLKQCERRYPHVDTTESASDAFKSDEIEAVAISTPVHTHFSLGKRALEHGKHVLMEKPLCETVEEANELISLSEKHNLTLLVDHTFLYTGAVEKIKEIVDRGELGELYYFDSTRINLGLFQHDINVVWDLAPHDFSIMDHLISSTPEEISAHGTHHTGVSEDIENTAYVVMHFDRDFIAHFNLNWLAPAKVRKTIIGGSEKMIIYDDNEPTEKVKVYDRGVDIQTTEEKYETLIQYRTGDMYAPKLDQREALRKEIEHFYKCIKNNTSPRTDGVSGREVVRLLQAAQRSIGKNGKIIPVKW